MPDLSHMVLEAKLTVNIADSACQLDLECAEILLPPPKGIYLKTRLEPVMVDGNNYYVRRGNASEPIADINDVVENVYDEHNKLVIPKSYLAKRERYLANEPFLPYRACKIIECMANETIEARLAYRTAGRNWSDKIESHFRPEVVEVPYLDYANDPVAQYEQRKAEVDALLDEALCARNRAFQSIKQEIELFIGNLTWHMYYAKLTNATLSVERFCDYRVHLWELEHGNKFRGIPEEEG